MTAVMVKACKCAPRQLKGSPGERARTHPWRGGERIVAPTVDPVGRREQVIPRNARMGIRA